MEKTQSNSIKIRNKTRLFTPYLFNIVPEVLAKAIRQLKQIKGYKLEGKKLKYSYLFTDDMTVYISDLKTSIRQLL